VKSTSLLGGSALAILLTACGGSSSPPSQQTAQKLQGGAQPSSPVPLMDDGLRVDQIPGLAQSADSTARGRQRQGATTPGLVMDTRDREAVRVFFNGAYSLPEAPMNWTGSYVTGDAGSVSAAYLDSALLRLNWFRAMAGVPANITFLPANNAKDQAAAMLMSVNNQLSHFPPSTWKGYNAVAADAAGHSNMGLVAGVDGINANIYDPGEPNYIVGHRRGVLYPQNQVMGFGAVPGGTVNGVSNSPAHALWVYDDNFSAPRPTVRDDFVAWPPAGYVPYPVVWGRWSLSYPKADFSQAKLTVTLNGVAVGATTEQLAPDVAGENTLVWLLQGTDSRSVAAKPASDQRYHVTVSNVLIAGQAPRTFSYDVVVFDPAVPTPGAAVTTVQPPAQADITKSFNLGVAPMSAATGYSITQYQRQPLGDVLYNAPAAAVNWTAHTTGSYNSMAGSSFRLVHADWQDQSLTLNQRFLANAKSSVSLTRLSRYTTSYEVLHLQVSKDGGNSWNDLYTETGAGNPTAAQTVQRSLAAYAGANIQLRALLTLPQTEGSNYAACDDCGWQLSDISLSNVEQLSNEQTYPLPTGASLSTQISRPGNYAFFGRTQYQGRYYSEFGPAALLHVDGFLATGPLSNYTITKTGDNSYTIVDQTGKDGTQTVTNPFRLDFTDVSLAFDIDGNAGKMYRLYQSAFNRQPDAGGLGYWLKILDGGATLQQAASAFAASGEFKTLYGSNPSKEQMVTAAYNNVLHRDPDSTGFQYWLDGFKNGLTLEGLLLNFADSKENRDQTAAAVANGIVYIRH
jgi:hypothetical protein